MAIVPPAEVPVASARELLSPNLQQFLDDLEEVAERHGRTLSLAGLVGSIELNFAPSGYASTKFYLFLKPSLRVRRRKADQERLLNAARVRTS